MFAVVRFDSRKEMSDETQKPILFKTYKAKKAALKCAYLRNEMVSTQALGHQYYVYDQNNKELLRAEKVA